MFVVFCVGSGFCDELITRSEEFYRVCVCVCLILYDLEKPLQRGGRMCGGAKPPPHTCDISHLHLPPVHYTPPLQIHVYLTDKFSLYNLKMTNI